MRTPRVTAVSVVLLLACAGGSQLPIPLTAPPTGAVVPAEYVPTGEVVVGGRGATFSDWRVAGPTVNLTRDADGSWRGSILGQSVVLKPSPGKLYGSGADLNFVRWGDYIMVQGNLSGQEFQIRYLPGPGAPTKGGKICQATPRALDCSNANAGGAAALAGQAALPNAPMPQLGLALIATML
jgi:hypothetical protein